MREFLATMLACAIAVATYATLEKSDALGYILGPTPARCDVVFGADDEWLQSRWQGARQRAQDPADQEGIPDLSEEGPRKARRWPWGAFDRPG